MAAASTIDRLPADIRERLHELLRDPRVTQLDATRRINEILADEGESLRLSKSAVNRYDLKMRQVGAKLAQSREIAEMWIGKLGAAPQGQVGNLVNEILRTLAFEISIKLQEMDVTPETMPEVVDQLQHLSLVAMRLEKAASENVKREAEIKKQVLAEAAAAIDETAQQHGVSQAAIEEIHRVVLGI